MRKWIWKSFGKNYAEKGQWVGPSCVCTSALLLVHHPLTFVRCDRTGIRQCCCRPRARAVLGGKASPDWLPHQFLGRVFTTQGSTYKSLLVQCQLQIPREILVQDPEHPEGTTPLHPPGGLGPTAESATISDLSRRTFP